MSLSMGALTKLTAASGTSVSGNLSAAPQAGSLLICAFVTWTNTNPGSDVIATSPINNWYPISRNRNGNVSVSWWYARNVVTSGTVSLTATRGDNTSNQGLVALVAEVRGADINYPLDVQDYDSFNFGVTANPISNELTNTYPNVIFLSWISIASAANPATITMNTAGWSTDTTNSRELNGSVYVPSQLFWRIESGSGGRSANWTIDSATNTCWALACFKSADTAAPQAVPTVTSAF